ncbi:MAG: radical SAM protein [bacterium]
MSKRLSRRAKPSEIPLELERSLLKIQFPRRPQAVILFLAPYSASIANLGYLTIWERANSVPGFFCDRAVWDARTKIPPRGLQTGLPLRDFEVILISSSFELDLIELVDALTAAGINPSSKERTPKDPFILTGGVAPTLNPEPWASVVDLVLLGEGEAAILEWIEIYRNCSKRKIGREALLSRSGELPFAWLPDEENRSSLPAHFADFRSQPARSPLLHPNGHFGDCFLIEITRGCPYHCLFCALTALGKPRFANLDGIQAALESAAVLPAQKVGLVGAAVGDHPDLKRLLRQILKNNLQITLSSLRIEKTDLELLELLKSGGLQSLTIAPEVGDEELRCRIGKKASDEDIARFVQRAAALGFRNVRFYFLIGLPEPEPPANIAKLLRTLRSTAGNKLAFEVSISSFIPKPGTPWSTAPFAERDYLDSTKAILKAQLHSIPGLKIHFEPTRFEQRAALFSNGNRTVGELLLRAKRNSRSLEQEIRLSGLPLSRLLRI